MQLNHCPRSKTQKGYTCKANGSSTTPGSSFPDGQTHQGKYMIPSWITSTSVTVRDCLLGTGCGNRHGLFPDNNTTA